MIRRTSNRVRKAKRTYSPSPDDDTSSDGPSTPRRIREESRNTSSDNSKVADDDERTSSITLSHNCFWNFAITLSHPIVREKIANDKVITLFLNEVSRAVRQLIFGAKLVMQKAKRQKLLCDDLNTFIEMEGGKILYGFTEDNKWQKIGDVFIPSDEILDLKSCPSSVKLETIGGR